MVFGSEYLDQNNLQIIDFLQFNPHISQSEIARQLNITQPSVRSRIRKLNKNNKFVLQFGINLKEMTEYNVIQVEIASKDPTAVMQLVNRCPMIFNGIKLTSAYDTILFMVVYNLRDTDKILIDLLINSGLAKRFKWNRILDIADQWLISLEKVFENAHDTASVCRLCGKCNKPMATQPIAVSHREIYAEQPIQVKLI
jgi:DNA-binding Lrp family transcriptional regulator